MQYNEVSYWMNSGLLTVSIQLGHHRTAQEDSDKTGVDSEILRQRRTSLRSSLETKTGTEARGEVD